MKITCTFDDTTHKVVPLKPTYEMTVAAWSNDENVDGLLLMSAPVVYIDMTTSAPPYPEQSGEPNDMVWIPCSERLPEPYTEVMVWPYPTDYCMTAEFSSDRSNRKGWCYSEYTGFGNERIFTDRITHWMPLPAAPKGK